MNDESQLHEQLVRYAGGDSSAEEIRDLSARLERDPAACDALAEILLQSGAIREFAQAVPVLVSGSVARRGFPWLQWRPLAAAAVVLIGVLSWHFLKSDVETRLIVASADAGVKVERDGAMVMLDLGAALRRGDVIVTGSESVVISYPAEETRLELSPATRLEVMSHREGKRLRLLAGSLTAEVAPQPEARPMRLFTSDAEAVVLGTRFSLNAEAGHAALAVQKGAVRVNRAQSGDSIVVSAQERVDLAAARLVTREETMATPSPWRDDSTLSFDFEADDARPLLRVGRVTGDPSGAADAGHCVAGELYAGDNPHLKFGVSFRTRWVVGADSIVRGRYWAGPDVTMIQINLRCDVGERGYLVQITPEEHERWVRWEMPLAKLRQVVPDENHLQPPPPVGARAAILTLMTARASVSPQLYFDDLVIEHISRP